MLSLQQQITNLKKQINALYCLLGYTDTSNGNGNNGSFIENDPTVPLYIKSISEETIAKWNSYKQKISDLETLINDNNTTLTTEFSTLESLVIQDINNLTQSFNGFKQEVLDLMATDTKAVISPNTPIPNGGFVVGKYLPKESSEDNKNIDPNDWGTLYPNQGNLRAKKGYSTIFYFNGTLWQKVEIELPKGADGKTIEDWSAKAFPIGSSVYSGGKIFYNPTAAAASTDVPGTSAVWVERMTTYKKIEDNGSYDINPTINVGHINGSNSYVNASAWRHTSKIPFKTGDKIKFTSASNNSNVYRLNVYDSTGNTLVSKYYNSATVGVVTLEHTFTEPDGFFLVNYFDSTWTSSSKPSLNVTSVGTKYYLTPSDVANMFNKSDNAKVVTSKIVYDYLNPTIAVFNLNSTINDAFLKSTDNTVVTGFPNYSVRIYQITSGNITVKGSIKGLNVLAYGLFSSTSPSASTYKTGSGLIINDNTNNTAVDAVVEYDPDYPYLIVTTLNANGVMVVDSVRSEVVLRTEIPNLPFVSLTTDLQPFKGKVMTYLGDSITQQNKYRNYADVVIAAATKNVNAVAGSCVTKGTDNIVGDGTARVPIVDRASTITGQDLIFVFAGINDWYYNIPIGTESSTVLTTFFGSYKETISVLINNNPGARIVTATPLQRGTNRNNYTSQKSYADAIVVASRMYGVPCIDLFGESGITFENIGTFTSDNVHPNTIGGERIGKFIGKFINSL